jgi:hypothetical protein
MPFNVAAFEKATFEPRKREVSLKDTPLAGFFPKGEEPVIVVKGLTATENAIANNFKAKDTNVAAMVEALVSAMTTREKAEELKKAIGFNDEDTPQDVAKRMELIRLGAVEPRLDYSAIAKMGEVSVAIFYKLSNTVMELTALGHEQVKRGRSTGKAK